MVAVATVSASSEAHECFRYCNFVPLGTGNALSPGHLAPLNNLKTKQTLEIIRQLEPKRKKLRTLVAAQASILTYAIGQQCEPIATRPRSYRMQAGSCIEMYSVTTNWQTHSRDHSTREFLVAVTPTLLNPERTINEVRNTNDQT